MAFLQFLRKRDDLKKREDAKYQQKQSVQAREQRVMEVSNKAAKNTVPLPTAEKTPLERHGFYGLIKAPVISEKSSGFSKQNVYAFKIGRRSNKIQIKKAVFALFGVDAVSVRIMHVPPKKVRRGRKIGWKEGYKKALVKVKAEQKIDL